MNLYVIYNDESKKYVSSRGSDHSYTQKLELARTFGSRLAAQRHACGNEIVRSVADVLQPPDDSNF